jgi:hypothetical protein
MPTIDTSRELMFPKLSTEEIDRLRRFGTVRRYAAGELLYATGDISPGMLVILSGSVAIRNVFLFVGVEPATGWLEGCGVALHAEGFVRTGPDDHQPRPLPLESNLPGVFAVGDVRSGSAKRVGGAIGEGAAVVPQLHTVLADAPTPPR